MSAPPPFDGANVSVKFNRLMNEPKRLSAQSCGTVTNAIDTNVDGFSGTVD